MAAIAQTAHSIHISAGSLDSALLALAAQSHDQLLYSSALVAGRSAPALDGELTTEQALLRLLSKSGIVVRQTGPAVFVLRQAVGSIAPVVTAPADAQSPPGASRPFGDEPVKPPAGGPSRPFPLAAAAAPAAAATVSEVEVTGSHIRGGGSGASPLTVISRADFEASGQLTIAGALSVLPQNFNGQDTDLSATTNTDNRGLNNSYGVGVNLRGLGSNASLVLVNGRRLGGAGAKGDFTDVSTLPSIALQRAEVLLDGASAIYGSDAVGGVVNLIMRRDLDGGEARLEGGTGEGNTPREGQLGLIEGRTWSGGGVVLAYEAYHRTALVAQDRDFAASPDLRPFGGTDFRTAFAHPGNIVAVNPATGISGPFFGIPAGQNGLGLTPASFTPGAVNLGNSHFGLDLLPDQERSSAYMAVHQDLGAHVELTGDVIYGFRRARTQLAPPTSTLTVTTADPFFVSPNGTKSESITYSFQGELPPPVSRGTAETLAVTGGATAELWRDWRAEGFVDFSQEIEEGRVHGIVNSRLLAEALGNTPDTPATAFSPARDGFFNPFTGVSGANSAATLAAIASGYTFSRRESRVSTASLQADGSIYDLPAGAVKLAVGGQLRHETFTRIGANHTSTVAETPQASTDVERSVGALFTEADVPLFGQANARPGLQRLELTAAVRWEHYNDFGSTVNPKFGVLWSPVEDVNVHATYGTSFRAPGLRELDDPQLNSPVLLPGTSGANVLSLLLNGGNPNLRPETAKTLTVGADWQPLSIPGLRVSLTGFDVRYRNRIDTPGVTFIGTALTDPALSTFVRHLDPTNAADEAVISALLASPATSTAQGSFPAASYGAVIDGRNVNTGALEVSGLDLNASYGHDLAGGRLQLGATGSDLLRYDQAFTPTGPSISRSGLVGFPARWRARFSADWTRDALTVGAAVNGTSAFHDAAGAHVDALATVDLLARWTGLDGSRWRGVTAQLTVRNLFNTDPPFFNNPLGFAFDGANADVVGRFAAVQLTKTW